MIKSFLWTVFFLLCFILFETAVLSNIFMLPAIPDFLLLIVIYIAFKNGSLMGETTGFLSGFLIDFLSASPLGLQVFLRTFIGFIVGRLKGTFNTDMFYVPALLGFTCTLLKALGIYILSFFFGESFPIYSITSSSLWFEVLFNTVLAPVMFGFLTLFSSVLIVKVKYTDASDRS